MIKEILVNSRSYRRFDESKEIEYETILNFVDNLRFCPSAKNQQVLVYKIIVDKVLRTKIYSNLKWAGYLENWNGPAEKERPTAFVVIAMDKEKLQTVDKWVNIDLGIVTQTLLMQATESGLGGCAIGAFNKIKISEILNISENIDIQLIIALGYPNEEIEIEEIENNESIKYRREENLHIVPKRKLKDILF